MKMLSYGNSSLVSDVIAGQVQDGQSIIASEILG